MPKNDKPRYSFKMAQTPGRFKLYEQKPMGKTHIANIDTKFGQSPRLAEELTRLLNAQTENERNGAGNIVALAQQFDNRLLEEARLLLTDTNEQYNRAIIDLVANMMGDADTFIDAAGDKTLLEKYEEYIRTGVRPDAKPQWDSSAKEALEEISSNVLKAEEIITDLDGSMSQQSISNLRVDIESLVGNVQTVIDNGPDEEE